MARVTTKADLITPVNQQLVKMWEFIDSMSEEQQVTPFAVEMTTSGKEMHWRRDKNLRDVLAHLYEWHNLLLNWVQANSNGVPKPSLSELYNWRTYPVLNVELWKKHRNTLLEEAKENLKASHNVVMALMENCSNGEPSTKGSLPWTGISTLGAYCASVTASYYDWATKKIKKRIKYLK